MPDDPKVASRSGGTPLQRLMYCCECMRDDYNARNFGKAEGWVSHISQAFDNYEEDQECQQ